MIELIDDLSQTANFEDNVFTAKIISNMRVYKDNNQILTWCQGDNALLQADGGVATLWADKDADFDELDIFLQIIGVTDIFTSPDSAKRLSYFISSDGVIMEKTAWNEEYNKISPPHFPVYSKIYSLLKGCGMNIADKNTFISDMIYRRKAGACRIIANADYTAAAISGYETEDCAVITAVAVQSDKRLGGRGRDVLNSLCGELSGKRIFLYCEADKNEQFYIKNGFSNCGKFVICQKNQEEEHNAGII